uniref:Uncharacterized protein n=1 Tax=Sphaerodactylus townsendi TaxID=933632 RepID=A0ACB8EGA2_9SAUR
MFFLQSSEEAGRFTSALLSEKAPTPKEDHISCRVKEEAEFVQNSLEAELSAERSLIPNGVNLSCLVKEKDQDLKAIELPADDEVFKKEEGLASEEAQARLPGGSQGNISFPAERGRGSKRSFNLVPVLSNVLAYVTKLTDILDNLFNICP